MRRNRLMRGVIACEVAIPILFERDASVDGTLGRPMRHDTSTAKCCQPVVAFLSLSVSAESTLRSN